MKDPEFAEEAGFYGSGMSRGEFAAEFCDALDWDGDRTVDWFEFRDEATTCVEINQCVGCTRQFFTKSFLSDGAVALVPSSGEEPASPRHRAGVASIAWRTTRRFSTNAP